MADDAVVGTVLRKVEIRVHFDLAEVTELGFRARHIDRHLGGELGMVRGGLEPLLAEVAGDGPEWGDECARPGSDTAYMPEPRLYLIRHAESEGNANRIMQGAGEYPLSETGRTQALRAAAVIGALQPSLVVASDLARAKDTALLAAGRVDRTDQRLRERGAGPWEGRLRSDLEAAHPGALEDDALRPEGFEPAVDVAARMRAATTELLEHAGVVVAVTHGAVLRLLEKDLGGTGARFGHLEALVLGPGLVVVGRANFVPIGDLR